MIPPKIGALVSRETAERLALLVTELHRWQPIQNLVGPKTLPDVWQRHIADSLQLLDLAPQRDGLRWVDLGSGAGFPGLVVAIAGADRRIAVELVESNGRKCAFLRTVVRLTGAPARVHAARLETVVPTLGTVDVVSARALAPLRTLLRWCEPLLTTGAVGLFPKGREADAELTEAAKDFRFDVEAIPSRTDSSGRILRIGNVTGLS